MGAVPPSDLPTVLPVLRAAGTLRRLALRHNNYGEDAILQLADAIVLHPPTGPGDPTDHLGLVVNVVCRRDSTFGHICLSLQQ